MPGYDVASFGGALKDDYEDLIADAVPSKSYLLSTLDDATEDVEFAGNAIVFEVDVDANQSYGINTMDGSAVPPVGRRNPQQARVNIANHAITAGLTDEIIMRSQRSEGAFISATKKIAQDTSKDLAKRVNQALYGKVLWAATANSAAAIITLESVQWLRIGDVIQVGNRTTGAITGQRTIIGRNIAAKTITVDSNVAVTAATDGVWYLNAGPVDTKFIEGLRFTTQATRTLHNINSATYPNWSGNEQDALTQEAGEQVYINLFDRVFEREIGEITDCVASPGMRTNLAKDLISLKRVPVSGGQVKLPGGFDAVMVSDVPVVRESDSPKGFAFGWQRSSLKTVKGGKPGWMKPPDGGDTIFVEGRNASGQRLSSWEATYRMYLNLLAFEPGATGQIKNARDNDPVV